MVCPLLPFHCLSHLFLIIITKKVFMKWSWFKGSKDLFLAYMPLAFCKYLLTSLNSVASVAKFQPLIVCFLNSFCDAPLVRLGCWCAHLVQCVFMVKCNWVRTWHSICLCHPQLSRSVDSLLTESAWYWFPCGLVGLRFTSVLKR